MIVDEENGTLLLKLRDPTKVTGVIPNSRTVDRGGVPVTEVKHGFEETKVLRNLGLKAPSPIRYYYEWRSKPEVKPYPYQVETSEFLTMNRRAICLNDMGTGKTLSTLWATDYLMDIGVVRKAIIVTPISTMDSVWANEIQSHFMFNRKCVVVYGPKAKRQQLLQEDADFYIINHDGLKTVEDELKARTDIDLWIIDEAAAYRNAQTARYKLLLRLLPEGCWLWMLTGTPCPTSPTDAWALARLLGNPNAPKYFRAFKDMTMNQITQYKWVPKDDAYQTAYKVLQPGIRFRKEDVLSHLPPVSYQLRKAELTKEQERLFKDMKRELVMSVQGAEVTAANAAVKLLKLLQVTTGAVYDEFGDAFNVDASKRLKVLEELVEESAHKVVVFVPFTAVLRQVRDHLAKRWTVAVVDGSTSIPDRKQIFADFQNKPDPQIILAHPKTTAHGLTLTAADHTIWYSPIFSLEVFEQANNRMDRPGQRFNMTISMIAANKMELELYRALSGKQRMQDSVLDLYKKEVGQGGT